MATTIRKLGDFIDIIDKRNKDNLDIPLLGVSIKKELIPSIANTIGTDMTSYKIIQKGQFAYGPVTSRNGDKVSIALLSNYDDAIVSQAYIIFKIIDKSILNPDYLMLWFKRAEFDRYARFKSHGSAREIFSWEEMRNIELPVPDIEDQRKIVHSYQTIMDRIDLLQRINDSLEEIAYLHFRKTVSKMYENKEIQDGWEYADLKDLCDVKGGKRLPADKELIDTPTNYPYIRVRDINNSRYTCLTEQSQYIDDDTHKSISRYIVNTDDIIISIVGTIGLIGKIHHSLDGANLTENCVRLTNIRKITSDYLYYTLRYKKHVKEIDLLTVGAVQPKLPLYNIQAIKVLVPPEVFLKKFQERMDIINQEVEANAMEIQKLHRLAQSFLAGITKGGIKK